MRRLKSEDLRKIWLLVNECRELGDDALTWRVHLVQNAVPLMRSGPIMLGSMTVEKESITNHGVVDAGFDQGYNRQGWINALEEFVVNPHYHPVLSKAITAMQIGKASAFNRPEVMSDKKWYRCHAHEIMAKVMGTDDCFIPTAKVTNAKHFEVAVINSPRAQKSFSEYEKLIGMTIMREVGPLIGNRLADYTEPHPSQLGPRCRQVLACLLEGDSDKQIAKRLKISNFTVNDYVKTIFKHFGVLSRTELMARWIRRNWSAKFAWLQETEPSIELQSVVVSNH